MTTAAIKQKLHSYIERADDKKLKAIYTLLEREVVDPKESYSEDFKAELDKRYIEYKNGGKVITQLEMDIEIAKLLNSVS